jgi:hypothetical protein
MIFLVLGGNIKKRRCILKIMNIASSAIIDTPLQLWSKNHPKITYKGSNVCLTVLSQNLFLRFSGENRYSNYAP